jgi:hypothetical protein
VASESAAQVAEKTKDMTSGVVHSAADLAGNVAGKAKDLGASVASTTTDLAGKAAHSVVAAAEKVTGKDLNGDGKVG